MQWEILTCSGQKLSHSSRDIWKLKVCSHGPQPLHSKSDLPGQQTSLLLFKFLLTINMTLLGSQRYDAGQEAGRNGRRQKNEEMGSPVL